MKTTGRLLAYGLMLLYGTSKAAVITVGAFTQTAIVNAISAANCGSDTISFPAGTYPISSTITLKAGCTYSGVRGKSILQESSYTTIFSLPNGSGTTITGLVFDFNNQHGVAIDMDYLTPNLHITFNVFKNARSDSGLWGAIKASNGTDGGPQGINITDNVFLSVFGLMFNYDTPNGLHWDRNYGDDFYQGIGAGACQAHSQKTDADSFDNNIFKNHQRMVIEVCGQGMPATTINGNYFGAAEADNNPDHSRDSEGCPYTASAGSAWPYMCNSFTVSWATGAQNSTFDNNVIYRQNQPGSGWGVEWTVAAPSELKNNVIKGANFSIFDQASCNSSQTNCDLTRQSIQNNIACGGLIPTQNGNVWGNFPTSNHLYSSCSNAAVPADIVIPCASMNPDGSNNAFPTGCGATTPPPNQCTVSALTQSAIQNCINSANVGDTVFLPSGTYNINSTIGCVKNLTITGPQNHSAILHTTGGYYTFSTNDTANTPQCSYTYLTFDDGGIQGLNLSGTIAHNIFKNRFSTFNSSRNGTVSYFWGLQGGTIDSNVFLGFTTDPEQNSQPQLGAISIGNCIDSSNVTNNYIDGGFQGIGMEDRGCYGFNNHVDNNILRHLVSSYIEIGDSMRQSTFNNNYLDTVRKAYPGHTNNPDGNGNTCDPSQRGGYYCDNFGFSVVGAGSSTMCNNKIYGPGVWGMEYHIVDPAAGSNTCNNEIRDWGIFTMMNDDGDANPHTGNVSCGNNPGQAADAGNTWFSSCSNPSMPAASPVPCAAINPNTGANNDNSYPAGCGSGIILPSPDFTITAAPATRTLVPGASSTYTVSLAPQNGFNSAVTLGATGFPGAASAGYQYYRAITINHTQVGAADLTNFPVLISGAFSYLKTVANGGRVQSQFAYDIAFFSDSAAAQPLKFERNYWDGSTGLSEFWVQIPTISHTIDTVIYMFYGSPGIVADTQNRNLTWDSTFKSVYHLGDGVTVRTGDSTGNADLTNNGATATAGQIDGGVATTGGTNLTASPGTFSGPLTMEAWVKPTATPGSSQTIVTKNGDYSFWIDTASLFEAFIGGAGAGAFTVSPALTVGAFNHLAITADGTNIKAYVNGSPAYSAAFTGQAGVSGAGLELGNDGSNESFAGVLDEVRVSGVARTAGWVAAEWNNQKVGSTFAQLGAETMVNGGSFTAFSFVPNPITVNGGTVNSTLSFTLPADATPGAYTIAITASSGTLSHSSNVSLTVSNPPAHITNLSVTGITNTQAIVKWHVDTVPSTCTVQASQSSLLTPLAIDVNPALFLGSNLANRPGSIISGTGVQFVLGTRVTARALDGRKYSRALQAGTLYYVRVTCNSATADTQFRTAHIPFGNTWLEQPMPDSQAPGEWLQPSVSFSDRAEQIIDPHTGDLIRKVSLPNDQTDRSTNQSFTFGFGAGWTNPANATTVNGSFATIANNSAKLAITGPTGTWANLIHAPNSGQTPQDEYVPTMLQGAVSLKSSNASCVGGNTLPACAVSTCVTTNGTSCSALPVTIDSQVATFQVTSTLAAYTIGTGVDGDVLQSSPGRPFNQSEAAFRNGTITCNSTTTATWTSGDLFPGVWATGSGIRITVSGTPTNYTVATYTNTRSLVLSGTCAAGVWPFTASNFGLLVWRPTPNADTISVDGASLNYTLGLHRAPPDYSGAYNQCSDTTVVGPTGNAGYNCTNDYAGGAQVFWIDSLTGESHIFAKLGGTFVASPFKPGSPDSWYIDIGGGNIQVRTYVGDHLEPSAAQTDQAGHAIFGVFNGDLFQCNGTTHTTRCYNVLTLTSSPNNTMGDLTAAFNPLYDKAKFAAWAFQQSEGGILHWTAQTAANGLGWNVVFDPTITTNGQPGNAGCLTNGNTGCVVATMPSWSSPGCRWCTIKAGTPIYVTDWVMFTPYFDQTLQVLGPGQGPFVTSVVGAFPSTTSACPANIYGQTNNCVTLPMAGEVYSFGEGTGTRGSYGNTAVGDQVQFPNLGTHYNSESMILLAKNGLNWTFARNYNGAGLTPAATIGSNAVIQFTCSNIYPEAADNSLRGKEEQWNWRNDIFGLNASGTTIVNSANGVNAHYYQDNGTVAYSYSQDTRCTNVFGCYQGQRVTTTLPDLLSGITPISGLAAQGPSFFGLVGPYNNGGWQSHPWGAGAQGTTLDQRYFFDARPFLGFTITPTVVGVSGQLYRIPAGSATLNRKILPTLALAGPHPLLDVSSARIGDFIPTDNTGAWQYCVALVAGECRSTSLAGDAFVNVPGLTYLFCQYYGGNALQNYEDVDVCLSDASVQGNTVARIPLDKFDMLGRQNQYLTHGLVRPHYLDPFWHGHPLGNGRWIYNYSQAIDGYASGELVQAVPPVVLDSTNRTTFESLVVHATAGANNAIVEFGYAESSPAGQFLNCTSRGETCAVGPATLPTQIAATPFYFEQAEAGSLAGTPCSTGCDIAIPVLPAHVVYWQIKYRDAGKTVIRTGPLNATAVY
jgi:hypothetical protein